MMQLGLHLHCAVLRSKTNELACGNSALGSLQGCKAFKMSCPSMFQHGMLIFLAQPSNEVVRYCLAVPGTVLAAKTFCC